MRMTTTFVGKEPNNNNKNGRHLLLSSSTTTTTTTTESNDNNNKTNNNNNTNNNKKTSDNNNNKHKHPYLPICFITSIAEDDVWQYPLKYPKVDQIPSIAKYRRLSKLYYSQHEYDKQETTSTTSTRTMGNQTMNTTTLTSSEEQAFRFFLFTDIFPEIRPRGWTIQEQPSPSSIMEDYDNDDDDNDNKAVESNTTTTSHRRRNRHRTMSLETLERWIQYMPHKHVMISQTCRIVFFISAWKTLLQFQPIQISLVIQLAQEIATSTYGLALYRHPFHNTTTTANNNMNNRMNATMEQQEEEKDDKNAAWRMKDDDNDKNKNVRNNNVNNNKELQNEWHRTRHALGLLPFSDEKKQQNTTPRFHDDDSHKQDNTTTQTTKNGIVHDSNGTGLFYYYIYGIGYTQSEITNNLVQFLEFVSKKNGNNNHMDNQRQHE